MVKFYKRKKLFDEDADWVPQKGRQFKMKAGPPKEEPVFTQGSQDQRAKEEPIFTQGSHDQRAEEEVPKEEPMEKQKSKIKTDAEGMGRAYAQGDVYGEGNKEYVAGSHTYTDWFDDFTKTPQWQYFLQVSMIL